MSAISRDVPCRFLTVTSSHHHAGNLADASVTGVAGTPKCRILTMICQPPTWFTCEGANKLNFEAFIFKRRRYL